jgi:serine/threonine-protein kinase HipA
MDLAFLAADHFNIEHDEARRIAQEIAQAVAKWRGVAQNLGASQRECDRMATAFEHEDFAALRVSS